MRSKEIAIVGAGKIGRGYLSDLFSRAGYHLIFINGSPVTVDKLNEQGYYTLFTAKADGLDKRKIEGFEAYSSKRDFDTCVERLQKVDLIAVALYPSAYPSVADLLAKTIVKRMEAGLEEPLNVMFFVNMVFTARTFKTLLRERLDDQQWAYCEKHVGLIEALTHRGGYNPTEEMLAEDPLCISTGEGEVLPVGDCFVGERPDMPYMLFVDRIEGRMVKKIWCGNMRHCTTACIGKARGAKYTFECANDQYVRKCADYATVEAKFGIAKEFGFTQAEIDEGVGLNWESMKNPNAKDDVDRVCADPIRKLGHDERFIGPALLCLKYGMVPYFLSRGAAYLLLYVNEKDASAVEIQAYRKENGDEKTILKYCGLDRSIKDEDMLFQLIFGQMKELEDHDWQEAKSWQKVD